jgi:catechol 2,3-dioxygenase
MSSILPADLRLGPVKLKVSDLPRSLAFYTEVVGLRLLQELPGEAQLTADGQTPLVILRQVAQAEITPRRSAAGLYHFALLLPTREALGSTLLHLMGTGIHIGHSDHLVSEALYIADPDHNGIEIYRDRPRDTWRRDEQGHFIMATDPIDKDGLVSLAEGTKWEGLPPGTVIGHVHFHVQNLVSSRRFYCDVLGFDIAADASSRGALFISAGGYHHHIGLNIWAGENAPIPSAQATGLDYATIVFPDEAALQQALERLLHAGIETARQDGLLLVIDPSGIKLRLATA